MVDGRVHTEPVFVDRSGRRRRLFTVIGAGIGVALLLSLGLIIAGLFGAAPVHVPGLPSSGGVAAQPGISESAGPGEPSPTAGASGSRRPGTGLTPTPGQVLTSPTSPRRTAVPTDKPRPTRSH
jgi:hypothetical protein